jgi:hypothetical protein
MAAKQGKQTQPVAVSALTGSSLLTISNKNTPTFWAEVFLLVTPRGLEPLLLG